MLLDVGFWQYLKGAEGGVFARPAHLCAAELRICVPPGKARGEGLQGKGRAVPTERLTKTWAWVCHWGCVGLLLQKLGIFSICENVYHFSICSNRNCVLSVCYRGWWVCSAPKGRQVNFLHIMKHVAPKNFTLRVPSPNRICSPLIAISQLSKAVITQYLFVLLNHF